MTVLAYYGSGGSHLLTYLLHYIIARFTYDELVGHGVSSKALVVIALIVLAIVIAHRRRRGRRHSL